MQIERRIMQPGANLKWTDKEKREQLLSLVKEMQRK